jgi:hypothetical protein
MNKILRAQSGPAAMMGAPLGFPSVVHSSAMKRALSLLALLAFALLASPAWAADAWQNAVAAFKQAPESAGFFRTAYGYALFPTIGKGGAVVGGAYGKGRVYQRGRYVGDTSMTQLTVGFQLGGQAYSEIIFFENKDAFDRFTSGNFEFGGEASAVAITAGANAQAGTTGTSAGANVGNQAATQRGGYTNNGMAVFTVAKGGLMFEAVVKGQKFNYKPRARSRG